MRAPFFVLKKQDLFDPNAVFPVGIFRYKFLEIEIVFPGPDGFLEPEPSSASGNTGIL